LTCQISTSSLRRITVQLRLAPSGEAIRSSPGDGVRRSVNAARTGKGPRKSRGGPSGPTTPDASATGREATPHVPAKAGRRPVSHGGLRKEDPREGCHAGAALLAVRWALATSVAGSKPEQSGAHSESWSSRKSPREHRAPVVDSSASGATDSSTEKALRSSEAELFGATPTNDEKAGALETGRAAVEEGNASKGHAPVRRVGRTAVRYTKASASA